MASLLSQYITSYRTATPFENDLRQYISETLVKNGLGIYDADDDEIQSVLDHPEAAAYIFADMISRRAQIGWSTHGHSAVDVNIYGSAGSKSLTGNHENTEIGKFLRDYLNVDVDAITKKLREKLTESGTDFLSHLPFNECIGDSPDRYHCLRAGDVFPGH